ncbi:hypothetical protein [Paenibacillus sp. FSL M7-1046]|uniref:hypothetical protein n=1 Tax=Paenibacillus sp. FSL M7-1046 TaxID=2975315 RepID=UPI0030FC3A1E
MDHINDRATMQHHFDQILNKNYANFETKRRYSYGNNAIKTYVIESHIFNEQVSRDYLLNSILQRAKEVDSESTLRETKDENLISLSTVAADYFIDITSKRYVVLHTAEPTKVTDPFINKFQNAKGFDSLWLPVPLLLETVSLGRFWGMGVTYQDSIEESIIDTGDDLLEDVHDINLSAKRHFAQQFFSLLMTSELKYMMGVSRLSVLRESEERKDNNKFIIDDIKYNGKITAKGNSYEKHSRIVYELVKLYSEVIEKLETYGISFEEGRLAGNPITINFSRTVSPQKLINIIFTGEEPFRLWGVEDEIGPNQFRVYAVDMHHGNSGNKLTFEITENYMRISMPKYSCANTLLRLFSNINHYVDAMAALEVLDYELKVDLSRAGLGQYLGQYDVQNT